MFLTAPACILQCPAMCFGMSGAVFGDFGVCRGGKKTWRKGNSGRRKATGTGLEANRPRRGMPGTARGQSHAGRSPSRTVRENETARRGAEEIGLDKDFFRPQGRSHETGPAELRRDIGC